MTIQRGLRNQCEMKAVISQHSTHSTIFTNSKKPSGTFGEKTKLPTSHVAKIPTTNIIQYQQKHPIHKLLKKLNSLELNDITNKIGVTYNKRLNKMRGALAKYFFINHSSSPLTSLKKCLMAPTVKDPQPKIDENHPIFEFLKNVSDNEVKEWTKKSW